MRSMPTVDPLMEPQVIWEDNHLLAVNKPSGWLVQGDETGDITLADWAKQYIKEKYHKPGAVFLGVIHRLDRPVSGVVLFARNSKALARMNEKFRERNMFKLYWAVTDGKPAQPSGTLVHWLRKDEKKNKTVLFDRETGDAQRSELSYALIRTDGPYRLLEVKPITGRSHQIRVQLNSIKCPILGDLKYHSDFVTGDGSIALHARQLRFEHPVGGAPVVLEAPVPDKPWWKPFASE